MPKLLLAIPLLVALLLAATAWAGNGGTAAGPAPAVRDSGGVSGPEPEKRASAAQQPAQEQPPQVETTPTETTPEEGTGTVPDTAPTAPTDLEGAPGPGVPAAGGAGGGEGGGLPSTGLQIGALAAVGLGLLLAGLALRRRPSL